VTITLWGVRGSIATPLTTPQYRTKLKAALRRAHGVDLSDDAKIDAFIESLPRSESSVVGGNTTCVEVTDGETLLVIDAGSGMRLLGQKLLAGPFGRGQGVAHVFFTHHHHDHTSGFPFFVPAYIPGNQIQFYGVHDSIQDRMVGLQITPYFPVPFHIMASGKDFHQLECDVPYQIGSFTVTPCQLNHPGIAYGYRIQWRERVFVLASDSEYKNPSVEDIDRFIKFFLNADILYFDGQYSLQEAFVKENWGHSSALVGVDFAVRANVKKLLVGHHDPMYSDDTISELIRQAEEYRDLMYADSTLEVVEAREGDTFDLSD
jgi:phosphoribosyl 1,2-cyclic phosphodiesterase